jgi:hypothetical protein
MFHNHLINMMYLFYTMYRLLLECTWKLTLNMLFYSFSHNEDYMYP